MLPFLTFLALLSAGSADAAAASAPHNLAAACRLPNGWSKLVGPKSRYVIFGEVHGTEQSPALVGSIACGLAARGERVLVALEKESTDDPALQRAWSLPQPGFEAALRRVGWAGRTDGLASEAMFALLVRLHALKVSGKKIGITAFNAVRDEAQRKRYENLPGQGPHEAAQAENIRNAAALARYDHVLVLVGNYHARKLPRGEGDTRYEPMAMRLAPSPEIVSLMMLYSGGTMWNCLLKPGVLHVPGQDIPLDALDCGNHPSHGNAAAIGQGPLVGLGMPAGVKPDPAYDGFYWVGPVSGSPPLIAEAPPAAGETRSSSASSPPSR